jgi:hypothetical protein
MEYHVRPLGKACAGTGAPLAPGSTVTSVLVERGGELVRLDYSSAGWRGPPEGLVGQWSCHVPVADAAARPLDPDALLTHFELLLENSLPGQEELLYVLALLLLQKRRLRLEGAVEDDDGQLLQLVGSRGEGPFQIRDQQLSEEAIRLRQAEIQLALEADWQAAG